MKRLLITLIFSPLILSAQKIWTLEDCLQYADQNNLSVRQMENRLELNKINARQARDNMLPSLTAGGNASWNYGLTQNLTTGILENQTVFGNTWFIGLNMPLFRGFLLQKNKQLADLNVMLSTYQLEKTRQDIRANIAASYLQVLMSAENFRSARAQAEATRKQVEKMQELVKAGSRPLSDLKDLEAQWSQDKLNVVQARNTWQMAKLSLAQLLELQDISRFEVDTVTAHFPVDHSLELQSPEQLFEKYLNENPAYRSAQTNLEISRKQIEAAKSGFYPVLSLSGSWNTRFMDRERITGAEPDPDNPYRVIGITENSHERVLAPNFRFIMGPPEPYFDQLNKNAGFSLGFSLSIPVFNRFSARRQVEKAKVNEQNARLEVENSRKQFRNTVYKLHTDLLNAKQKLEAARQNREAAAIAYRYAMEKLNAGVISPYDLDNIKARKIKAENQYIAAKYEYLFKLKLLEISLKNNMQ